jgi:transcriptional regulator with XRE-family HTH domain
MTAKQDRQFGRRLRVARIALGISEQEAADAHGITLATYRRREAGKPWLSMRPLLEYRFTSANGEGLCQHISPIVKDRHVSRQTAPSRSQWRQRLSADFD